MKNLFIIYKFKSFLTIILNIIGLIHSKKTIIELKNGLKFYLDLSKQEHSPIAEIYAYGAYKFVFNKKNINIIFDIGSNIGVFSSIMSNMYPKSKIFTFEPNQNVYLRLIKNIKLNKLKNIKPYNLGLSDSNKLAKLYLNSKNSLVSSLNQKYVSKNPNIKFLKVNIKNIYIFMKNNNLKYIDILKLDCEGCEWNILKSLNKTGLLCKVHLITADIDKNSTDFINIKKLLIQNNFKIYPSKIPYLINAKNLNYQK